MGLDLRIPIGALFLSYGLLLGGYGFLRPQLVQVRHSAFMANPRSGPGTVARPRSGSAL